MIHPKLRAEYEAAIEANRRKIERNTLQHRARDLKKHWRRDALRFLILAYLAEPDGTAELRELLEQYVSQGEIRAKILNAVATRKMPPGLWRSRPTATQPAGVALPTLTIDGAQIDTGSRPPATMPAGDQSANGQ